MHLKKLRIQNFRAIEDVEVSFDNVVSVIIGPNAIGKTTILEGIRAAKAILASRTQSEGTNFLNTLGATSPHMPQRLFSRALSNRPGTPLIVKSVYNVHDDDLKTIAGSISQLASNYALQSSGISVSNPAQAASFLSSPQGKALLVGSEAQLRDEFSKINKSRELELNLTISLESANITGEFPIQQIFAASLDQSLPPSQTTFSYFPADRALPMGEQPVQLGLADVGQQLESYNSQPQLKYHRLKHTIFSSIIRGNIGRDRISEQFDKIFSKILKGRSLGEIGINEIGMLSIPIIDTENGNLFEIDSLSSGEKGLILTLLTIANSMAPNGIILLDEPELHLNPAVCRDLLQFLVDEYAVKMNVQVIICSHSAEILAGAFEHSLCNLYHLKSGKSLAKVRHQDRGEIRDALRRLGSSESEALLYKGTVIVEGIHDVETLRAGFDETLRRYRLRQRGGRGQVETDIEELQKAEKAGEDIGRHFFIFDHDRKQTLFSNTNHVRVLQLERFCLENYLLDEEILTDLSRDKDLSSMPQGTITEMSKLIERLAIEQLDEFVARKVFVKMGLEAVCFNMNLLRANSSLGVAAALKHQINNITFRLSALNPDFEDSFTREYNVERSEESQIWKNRWKELCDGKKVFEALRRDNVFKGDLQRLKRRVVAEMRVKQTETWHALQDMITSLLKE